MSEEEVKYLPPGGDWMLQDLNGRPFSHRKMKGSYYIMFFGHTLCPEATPLTVYKIAKAITILQNQKESQYINCKAVFVSVKPETDSPKHLRNFKQMFDPAAGLICLREK